MALRQFRERRTSITTGTDVKGDAPHEIAIKQLIPRIVRQSRNAVKVDRTEFYFYQRIHAGRRCSCFSIEQSPESSCGVCFNTGFVGGYQKYGCETAIVDITHPGLRCLNVEGNFDQRTRPVLFRLVDGAKFGFIECDVNIHQNVRLVDLIQVKSSLEDRRHSRVTAYVRWMDEFVPLNDANLSRALGWPTITIRVEFSRDTTTVASPLLSHVLLRYRKLQKPRVIADIPRRNQSVILEEFGISDQYATISLFFADEPRLITTEDIVVMCVEGTRWKIVDVSENKPGGILTSTDAMARLIRSWENYSQVPL